jgi:hypothetical protein
MANQQVPAWSGVRYCVAAPRPEALWVERPMKIEKKSRASAPMTRNAIPIASSIH